MNSYNKLYLEKTAKENGFVRDNLEKTMRLTMILNYFHNSILLSHSLVLKGGTAVNLTIFQMPRLSVDIDLDFTHDCSKEEMLKMRVMINKEILSYMNSEGYSIRPNSKRPHTLDSWVFGYNNAGGNHDTIKIEINYSDRCHVLPIEERNINIEIFGNIVVNVLNPIELFASKINALLSRVAVRDIYDVYNMIEAKLFVEKHEKELLRKTLVFYLAVGSNCKAEEVSLDFSQFNQIKELNYHQIRDSLYPVLRKNDKFDFNVAKNEVVNFLKEFLSFTDDERLFIKYFNKREYRPEVLFSNTDIVERIKSHPMALWKCRPKE